MSNLKISMALALVAVMAGLGAASIAFARPQAAASTTVRVKATDFHFALSTKTAHHGIVIFKLTNKGHTKHDFKIAGKKTPLIGPGKSATVRVTLKKGSYKYLCTFPGHAALGMKGTFRVT